MSPIKPTQMDGYSPMKNPARSSERRAKARSLLYNECETVSRLEPFLLEKPPEKQQPIEKTKTPRIQKLPQAHQAAQNNCNNDCEDDLRFDPLPLSEIPPEEQPIEETKTPLTQKLPQPQAHQAAQNNCNNDCEDDLHLDPLPLSEIPPVEQPIEETKTPLTQKLPQAHQATQYNCSQMIARIALVAMVGIIAVSITALAGGIPLSPLHATWMLSGATLLMIPLVWISIHKGNRCT